MPRSGAASMLTCKGLPPLASVWMSWDSSRCGGQETSDLHMRMCWAQEGAGPVRGLVGREWGVTVWGGVGARVPSCAWGRTSWGCGVASA